MRRLAAPVLLAICAVAWFAFLRPSSIGGPATYVLVSGHSMDPTLATGDLVVVLRRPTYAAGDVVAYRVPDGQPGEGGRIIHRITGGSGDAGYVLRGDNKSADDLWHPRDADVLGVRWLRVPGAGRVVAGVRRPLPFALLASVLAVFVALAPPRHRDPVWQDAQTG